MARFILGLTALIVSTAITLGPTHAGFSLKKALKSVEKIVKQAPKIVKEIPNPITTQIDILTGKVKPKDLLKSEGQKLRDLSKEVQVVNREVNSVAADVGSAIGGDTGRIILNLATAGDQLTREFLLGATSATGALLQGEDPMLAIASPLAAAIRDARNQLYPGAKPLPDAFKRLFAPIIPSSVLERARYSVGEVSITLPAVINAGNRLFGKNGGHHAVVVDDVIVFTREPNASEPDDVFWVAHELFHVNQYMEWGVDRFAMNYIKNYARVEAEADQSANNIHRIVMMAGDGHEFIRSGIHAASSLGELQSINSPIGQMQVMRPPQNPMAGNGPVLTDVCAIGGEQVVITNYNDVISPMRFNQVVGKRIAPSIPQCLFELTSATTKYCVQNGTGTVFAWNVQFPVGQCRSCNGGFCN